MANQPGSENSYRVAVFGAPDDADSLGRVLERSLGLHATDANIRARSAPGIFPERLSRDAAERLTAAIAEIGLQAQAISEAELPSLDKAVVVHHARCDDAGLTVFELHGRPEAQIAWGNVDVVSVGQVPQETARHYVEAVSTSIKAARHTAKVAVDKPLSPGPEAWIITSRPYQVFRVDHKRMNYEYLGERMSDSATANFRLFIDDVVARAPQAYLTPATRAWLESGSVEDYSFSSTDDLKRYTVLHLLIHRRAQAPQ
ncbi:MAG: hypothetical protein ACT4QC_04300 [Planctomycetaceae bacterium]